MKFLTIRRRALFIFVAILVFVSLVFGMVFAVNATSSPKPAYTIVIDAGHGGRDGGAVGKVTGVTESYLNLQYALKLKELCEDYGFNVVLTRKDMNGLYSAFASNKKKSEMLKRQEIIEKSNANLVVSLHMNSTKISSARGAQVFYRDGFSQGGSLAGSVQTALNEEIEYAKKTAKTGDFYILNCTDIPSILVECGFLSNVEEEILLQDDDYITKFCNALLYGILTYFTM